MADDDKHGERIARLEEKLAAFEARLSGLEKKLWGGVVLVLAFVWGKLSALLGIGGP
jgi:type II secretory pathway component PulM